MEDDQATDNPAPHELPEKWRAEKEEYPKVDCGPYASAVLKLCAIELEASLKAWDDSWKAQCHAQAEELVKLRDLIFEIEWSNEHYYCPICVGMTEDGHAPDCKLAKTMEPYR